jgi:acyl carrier protein
MDTKIFLEMFQEALEEEAPLKVDTKFADLSNFDSMSILIIIAFVDENFGVKINAKQFEEIKGVTDLMNQIGAEQFT